MKDLMIKQAKPDFIEMLVLTFAVVLLPGVMIAVIKTISKTLHLQSAISSKQ